MPTLGLCVIVRNGAATLRGCLASVSGLVDEVVVVDTGSTDGTVEIARACGANVLSHPWCDDFAAVRNTALRASRTDWILVLDADEQIDAAAHSWIRNELRTPHADAYITPVRNYLKPQDRPLTGVWDLPAQERHPLAPEATHYVASEVVRLYKRAPEVYYIGHVHEQVEYRLAELQRSVGYAGFHIHHFGWYQLDADGWKRKQALYTNLLAEKHRRRPKDALVMLQYGDALCAWGGKVEEGLSLFMKAAAINNQLPDIWLYIALALLRLNQKEAALIAIEQMSPEEKRRPRIATLRGDTLAALQRREEARAAYAEALEQEPDAIPTMAKLALLEMEDGSRDAGLKRMRNAILLAEMQAALYKRAHAYLYAAELRIMMREWTEALQLITAGLAIDATLLPLHESKLRAAVAIGHLDDAASSAAALSELAPEPRFFLRHAAILNQNGKYSAARDAISHGLAHFPDAELLQQAWEELQERRPPKPAAGCATLENPAISSWREKEAAPWSM